MERGEILDWAQRLPVPNGAFIFLTGSRPDGRGLGRALAALEVIVEAGVVRAHAPHRLVRTGRKSRNALAAPEAAASALGPDGAGGQVREVAGPAGQAGRVPRR